MCVHSAYISPPQPSKKMLLTYRLVAGHGDQTLLLDVGLGFRVAATGVQTPVIDAQDHPITQPLPACHCALRGTEDRSHDRK